MAEVGERAFPHFDDPISGTLGSASGQFVVILINAKTAHLTSRQTSQQQEEIIT